MPTGWGWQVYSVSKEEWRELQAQLHLLEKKIRNLEKENARPKT